MTGYPFKITETPHRGEPRVWTLESEAHLREVLNGTEACRAGCLATDLESYLDWLRSDLRSLSVEEAA